MTFTGSLNIKQTGHAMLHIDEYKEDYLIPFPDFSVKGFLSGKLYPEISGTYHIISSSGFVNQLKLSGKGYFSGKRNNLEAIMYGQDDDAKSAIYVIQGQWSSSFTTYDGDGITELETWNPEDHPPAPVQIAEVSEREWRDIITSRWRLRDGNHREEQTRRSAAGDEA
jgi:oxysterol-binding protein-related protein 9/10/11